MKLKNVPELRNKKEVIKDKDSEWPEKLECRASD